MPDPARSLYEALRALEHRAGAARGKAGLPSSRREAAAVARKVPYEVELDSRRISSWLPADPASAQIPRAGDADKVWALVRVWSDWADDRAPEQRYWMDLIDAAQPARAHRPVDGVPPAGWPLTDVSDPFALEVHRPFQPDNPQQDLPVLPAYVPREHDGELARVVTAGAAGRSRIAVLVGGSSTGKTRACWEALRLLRDQSEQWRLWHPIDPSRPEAALRELSAIGPRTVVWLNEAQFYLDAPAGLGEQVAAGLRELLRDPARGPVLVLATLWPSYWDALTSRPAAGDDPHAQARELLVGRDISVPSAFTGPQLQRLREAGDIRLAQASKAAQDGQVTQFLAGVPELLARYRNAPPAAKALIHAAMDARRLGMRLALPLDFLEAAASAYLADSEWDQLAEDWLEQALAYTAAPCKGVRGPLTRIRPRPERTGDPRSSTGPAYQLADYLDQQGRFARGDQIPPASFWAAAARYADSGDLDVLGAAASARGLYRDAARLYKRAAAHGDTASAGRLVISLHRLHSADQRPARWAASHAALDEPHAVGFLLEALRSTGAAEQVSALLARDPAAHAPLDDPDAVAGLLGELWEVGAGDQVKVLASRAAAHAALDDTLGVAFLLSELRAVGTGDQAKVLASRATAHAVLDEPGAVAWLLDMLVETGVRDQVSVLLARDPAAHASLDDSRAVARLLDKLREVGAGDQVTALAARAAGHAVLDDPGAAAGVLRVLREVDARDQVAVLLAREPAVHAVLDDPGGVARLLDELREVGAADQVAVLLARGPVAHAVLDDPGAVARLLRALRQAGVGDQVSALLAREPAVHAVLGDPGGVAKLLDELREVGAGDQVTALADRAAVHAVLDDPGAVARLLRALREAGVGDQVSALLAREPAAHAVVFQSRVDIIELLGELREAGAQEQAELLIHRLPGAGLFHLFLEQQGHQERFRLGQEADGSPAGPWSWEDLD